MKKGLEIVESGRRMPAETTSTISVGTSGKNPTNGSKVMDVVSNNFESIMNLAGSIVEIKKMKVISDACLAKMAEDRKTLLAEAQAYATKKEADTSSVVERMNIVRLMMQDFYAHSNGNLSGEDFRQIITEVVNQMGRVEDGIR